MPAFKALSARCFSSRIGIHYRHLEWQLYPRIVKSSKFKLRPLSLFLITSLIVGCGSTPEPTPSAAVVTAKPVVVETPATEAFALNPNANDVSYQAVDAQAVESLDPQLLEQQRLLTEASNAITSQPVRALAISAQLLQSGYSEIRQPTLLLYVKACIATRQFNALEGMLARTQLTDVIEAQRAEFATLAADFYQTQQNPLAASHWLLALDAWLGNQADAKPARDALWQQLVQLSAADMEALAKETHPRAVAWRELLQITQTFAGDPASIQKALQDWQQRYPAMPVFSDLPSDIQQLAQVTAYAPRQIGVLLPMSGPMQSLGRAVQMGLVAQAKPEQRLFFFDSSQDIGQLRQQLQTANVEFVIGPLLKEHVEKVQAATDWPWPTLFLNNKSEPQAAAAPSSAPSNAQHFFFALAWEDEAQQMVQWFLQQNIQHPVLIHSQNPIHQRMADTFKQLWQRQTGQAVEHYSFASQDQVQPLISRFLETEASEQRVNEINKLAGLRVKAEVHSRQDIDAIYLIADPVQTRLFKPFIDVTISPGAEGLPIFTSSRSHSLNVDRTDQRDVAGLIMTEMPWLLPPTAGYANLRATFDTLYPEQDETLQRLFAMGFDALALVHHLQQQKQFPLLAYHGLTGSLRLKDGQSIQRQLTLAQYRQGKLTRLSSRASKR